MTIDARILSRLRLAGDQPVSGGDLAQELGITRAAIWARIEELRRLGYDIEASPHLGYRLRHIPDVLHADDLLSRISTRVIGRDIRVFQETASTNDVAEKLARDGVKEGAVVLAESQTRGRGRLGRRWLSPPGKGIWCSVLLRPAFRPQAVTQLTVAAAIALTRSIRQLTALKPQVKWPNDVVFGTRKAAGILTELSAELDQVRYVIIGIGIDVNLTREDFPADLRPVATSLLIESGHPVNRAALTAALLQQLDADYARICAGGFGEVADEWEAQCATLGAQVTIRTGDRQVSGRAESLDDDGALLLRTDHGHLERVVGGDVTLATARR